MTIKTCSLPGLLILEPRVFQDDRGYFFGCCRYSCLSESGLVLCSVPRGRMVRLKPL